jgi:alkylation response protein AidB-like acyl-CoA dehydrogenase
MAVTARPDSRSFLPSPVAAELAEAAREFLSEHASPSTQLPERSYDAALWRRVGAELGWAGITIGETYGGLGLDLAALCAVVEEAGRVLLGVPLADTSAFATGVAMFADASTAEALVPAFASADKYGTVAFESSLSAERSGSAFRLSGHARYVVHGSGADALIVLAHGDEPSLALVSEALASAKRRDVSIVDRTRPVAEIEFDDVEIPAAHVLVAGERATRAFELLRAARATALANESVGAADRCLEMGVGYALERKQFGRPIGSFQAVKHRLANVLVAVEHARTAARFAAACPIEDEDEFICRAAIAKVTADEAFVRASGDNIQVHGGIGFTWEHPAHLYYKRAAVNAQIVWPTTSCREFVRKRAFEKS